MNAAAATTAASPSGHVATRHVATGYVAATPGRSAGAGARRAAARRPSGRPLVAAAAAALITLLGGCCSGFKRDIKLPTVILNQDVIEAECLQKALANEAANDSSLGKITSLLDNFSNILSTDRGSGQKPGDSTEPSAEPSRTPPPPDHEDAPQKNAALTRRAYESLRNERLIVLVKEEKLSIAGVPTAAVWLPVAEPTASKRERDIIRIYTSLMEDKIRVDCSSAGGKVVRFYQVVRLQRSTAGSYQLSHPRTQFPFLTRGSEIYPVFEALTPASISDAVCNDATDEVCRLISSSGS